MFLRFFRLMPVLLLALIPPVIQAQDTEATAEPTAETHVEVTIGAVTLHVPANWYVIEGQRGEPVVSNVDLLASSPNATLPADAVLIQLNLLSKIALPPDFQTVQTAREFLETIPVPEGEERAEVAEIEFGDVTFAKVESGDPASDSTAYVRFLSDDTVIFALVATTQPGVAAAHEPIIVETLSSLEVDMSAPFADASLTRYDDIPQSSSDEGFPQLGNPDAPVKIIEISSFDCPACRSFHDYAFPVILERIRDGDVLFVYVPIYGTGSLPNGEFAAKAAVCAAEQDAFWALHDGLFSWQDFRVLAFMGDRLAAAINTLELDTTAYSACLASEKPTSILNTAFDFARSTPGFTGTPMVLMNGAIINWTPEVLDQLIDDALAAAEAATPEPEATAETTAEATAEPTTIGSGF